MLASDAYFPFPDGVEEAAAEARRHRGDPAPEGQVKGDPDVIEAADRLGLAMVFTEVACGTSGTKRLPACC